MCKVIDLNRRQGRVLFFLIIILLGILVTDIYSYRTIATAAEDGLVGYWSFDKIEDEIVEDSSGNGNHGVIMGSVELATGRWGNALKFNGSDTYVEIPINSSLQCPDAITIEAWVYPTPPHENRLGGIINNINGSFSNSRLLVRDDGRLIAQHNGSEDSLEGPYVENRAWSHVVYVYDGKERIFYLDGQKKESTSYSGSLPVGPRNIIIGRGHPTIYQFNGIIDEVKIYNKALSQEEIEYSFNNPPNWLAIVM